MTAELSDQHARAQLRIRAAALADLRRIWPMLDPADLARTFPPFSAAAQLLIRTYRVKSSTTAAAYYVALRTAAQPNLVPLLPPDEETIANDAAARIAIAATAGRAAYRGVQQGADDTTIRNAALVGAIGSVSRLVMNGGRETLTLMASFDQANPTLTRVTSPGACAWCKDRVLHGFHDNCNCRIVPKFDAGL